MDETKPRRRTPRRRETGYDGWMLEDEHTGELLEHTLRRTREQCRVSMPRKRGQKLTPVKVARHYRRVQ